MNTTEVTTTTSPAAGWFADPLARNEHRHWDGSSWTDHVSNGGLITVDPIASTTPVVEQVAATPTVGSTAPATPALGEAASAAASAATKAAGAAIESLTAKVSETSKRHTPRQLAVAGVALVVLLLGTFMVGSKVVHTVTGGGGNFCADARAMAQKYAGINEFECPTQRHPRVAPRRRGHEAPGRRSARRDQG